MGHDFPKPGLLRLWINRIHVESLHQQAKRFYQQFDFQELPGYPMRLYLPFKSLEALAKGD